MNKVSSNRNCNIDWTIAVHERLLGYTYKVYMLVLVGNLEWTLTQNKIPDVPRNIIKEKRTC